MRQNKEFPALLLADVGYKGNYLRDKRASPEIHVYSVTTEIKPASLGCQA